MSGVPARDKTERASDLDPNVVVWCFFLNFGSVFGSPKEGRTRSKNDGNFECLFGTALGGGEPSFGGGEPSPRFGWELSLLSISLEK